MSKIKFITATRDGQEAQFHPLTWAEFPDHKFGWEIKPEPMPEVVKEAIKKAAPKGKTADQTPVGDEGKLPLDDVNAAPADVEVDQADVNAETEPEKPKKGKQKA